MLRSSPVVSGPVLFQLAESDPNLYLINRNSGLLIENFPTGDWTAAGPWKAGDHLFLLGKDGAALAYQILH